MVKSTELGMSFLFIENKDYFLSVHVDDIKNDWKGAECGSDVEEIDENR